MKMSESINELATALAQFQSNVKQPLKDANNPFFKSKYVPLENVAESVTSAAGPLGISYMQYAINKENEIGVSTLVMHKSGQFIEFEPIFAKPAKNDPQGVGSCITYLKRYSLSAAFGITSDEDDDGNSNSNDQQKNNKYNNNKNNDASNLRTAKEAQLLIVPGVFKKHEGKTLGAVWKEDRQYLDFMENANMASEEIKSAIKLMKQAAGVI